MFRRILVAVDGSEPSNRAVATAMKLAREGRARLRIVHVADTLPPASVGVAGEMYVDVERYRDAVLSAGRDVLKRVGARARATRARTETALLETLTHDPSAAIVAEAKRWRADLIALGTHGRTGLARLFLGSVAEGVARHAPVAVLLVRGSRPRKRTAATRRPMAVRVPRG